MLRTIEAVIESDGRFRLFEDVRPSGSRGAPVALLDESGDDASAISTAFPSESAFIEDWNRLEENAGWAHLQPGTRWSTMFTVVSCRHSTFTEEP